MLPRADCSHVFLIKSSRNAQFNLRGIAIGNGWIDPQRQYDGYVAFAKDRGLLEGQYMASAERHQTQCAEMYKKNGQRIKYPVCENILDEIINFSRSGWVRLFFRAHWPSLIKVL